MNASKYPSLFHLVLANVAKSGPALDVIPQTSPEIVDGHVVLAVGVVGLARIPAGEGVHVRPIGQLPDPLLRGVVSPHPCPGAGAGGVAGKRGDELVGGMVGDGGQVPVLRIVDVLRGELAVPARLPPERPAGEELVAEAVVGAPARGAAALHGLSLSLGLKQIQLLGS